ncbi:hypothetical protein [Cellulophaga sp. Hel_I_12]|uniref:hypothetical protein n=1 Tax=Cellulophaga sp. Hel_I_12 TaxID=1249972 RepID=UPI00068D7896|nr:hypothetical protein [Cellulophaga sp. Hel_I_12]
MKTKKELIEFINNSYGMSLNNLNTSFSNINKAKEVWWTTIPVAKFQEDVYLLFQATTYTLLLHLPKGFVENLEKSFKIRQDRNSVDLELSADKNFKYLQDIKSGGTGFDFKGFVKEKIVY